MIEHSFTQKDKENLIDFLNLIATKADFKLNTKEIIQYFNLLSQVQKVILPKIDKNILEISKIISNEETKEGN